MLAGYEEPSLVFALGADVGLTDGRGAAQWGADKGGLALVEDEEGAELPGPPGRTGGQRHGCGRSEGL